ncbi:MAG: permease [Candidatus Glassbacteria bacterium]|nr:permease [Candidatus Glassbacteria bacterium]
MLLELIAEIWNFTRDAAFYLLGGFALAGLIRVFITEQTVAGHLGGRGFKPVLWASLIGAPLPLCSCSVLPAAAGLRRQGASRAATTSFLISTPETGIDSLVVSYALLDPVMTIVRPVAALFTAFFTGAAELLFNREQPSDATPALSQAAACGGRGCDTAAPDSQSASQPLPVRLAGGLRYSFFTLLADLSVYMAAGLVLAGATAYFIPVGSFDNLPGGQWSTILLILGIGVPLYICATSSTPLAAALIAKGLSPGAALLLLLVGPATNLSALSVIWRILGPRGLVIYLAGITFSGLAFCFGLDWLYAALEIDPTVSVGAAVEMVPGTVANISAVILCLLLAYGIYKEKIRPRLKKASSSGCH